MVSGPQVSSVFSWWLSHVSVASTEVPTAVLFLYFIPKPIQAFPTFSLDYDFKLWLQDVVFQSLSLVQLFVTPWTAVCQGSPSITNPQSLPKLMSIKLVMPSIHLILCHPLLPPSIFPSIRVFSNELALPIRWLKYWNFSFSISPSNEYSELIPFSIDWLPDKPFWNIGQIMSPCCSVSPLKWSAYLRGLLWGLIEGFFWLCWVFTTVCGLLRLQRVGTALCFGARLLAMLTSLVVDHGF